jgi:hypothetical protein
MRRKRTIILQRVPIFLGTEGRSETGYGALLSRIARETAGIHIHIHVDQLQPGAGDPLELVKRAIQKISELERRREKFMHKTVLIDVASHRRTKQQRALRRKRASALFGSVLITKLCCCATSTDASNYDHRLVPHLANFVTDGPIMKRD